MDILVSLREKIAKRLSGTKLVKQHIFDVSNRMNAMTDDYRRHIITQHLINLTSMYDIKLIGEALDQLKKSDAEQSILDRGAWGFKYEGK